MFKPWIMYFRKDKTAFHQTFYFIEKTPLTDRDDSLTWHEPFIHFILFSYLWVWSPKTFSNYKSFGNVANFNNRPNPDALIQFNLLFPSIQFNSIQIYLYRANSQQ